MFGYGSRAGPVMATAITSACAVSMAVMAVRSPWWNVAAAQWSAHASIPASAWLPSHDPAASQLRAPPLAELTPDARAAPAMSAVEAIRANASIPFSAARIVAAAPYLPSSQGGEAGAEQCLTAAIYYEAGFESLNGERAVAQVVLNRLRNAMFPKTICGVISQGSTLRIGCQFTFTCDGSTSRTPASAAWDRARHVAQDALKGYVYAGVGSATHYHAQYVSPRWAATMVKITQIGAHIFYRWPGATGFVSAAAPTSMDRASAAGDVAPPKMLASVVVDAHAEDRMEAVPELSLVSKDSELKAAAAPLMRLQVDAAPAIVLRPPSIRTDGSRIPVPSGW